YATQLLQGGARRTGYLLKARILEPLQLTQALTRLSDGGTVVDPEVVGELLVTQHSEDPLHRLSQREREVLHLLAEGLSDKGIAERLFLSLHTVGTHVRRIFHKLDLPAGTADNRRVLAVLTFLQHRGNP
ncbi:response regulator transcription factor, partial [Streptomyces sp. NPDC049099]|uniref:response regulator transcription factor n=1 Tax=Streptomyces sp. NPDC049099 TaxID=3155768 RepID=UPI00342F2489